MNNNVTSLKDVKTNKKLVRLKSDIEAIIKVLDLTQRSLTFFKAYTPVQRIVSVLETEKNLLTIHLNKLTKELSQIAKGS